jgi:rhamnogalacturonyl hydrolase YesR
VQVPPFLAYYAVLHDNITLAREAHRQIQLYRDVLRTDTGLWAHILLGNVTHDPGLWATGNAWAAAGMLRVLATLKWSQFDAAMQSEQNDLRSWAEEILRATNGSLVSRWPSVGQWLTSRRMTVCFTTI